MPAFTPGPWAICEQNKHLVHSTINGRAVALAVGLLDDEQRANARLIAAAPELCDLLSLAQSYMWDYYQTSTNPAFKHMLMYDYNRIEELFNRIDSTEDKS